ncbi:MAG TPA: histidine kinase [Alloacidobacterium sp.]|nr:histidine kinase [Alloacidobacterium sp.]
MRHRFFLSRSMLVLLIAVITTVCIVLGVRFYLHSSDRGLPHAYAFTSGKIDDWQAFGGNWEIASGTMRNDSDERGAKLMTGSPYWKDYVLDADIQLLGEKGDAGIIVRSTDEETGADAYHGYYIGLRGLESRLRTDNSLILGSADEIWNELSTAPIPGGVVPQQWYHLRALVYECHIVASAFPLINPDQVTAFSFTDQHCIPAGRIGLRSYAGGGMWRNVEVHRARQADFVAMLDMVRNSKTKAYQSTGTFHASSEPLPLTKDRSAPLIDATPIGSLRMRDVGDPPTATVKGVVVATSPLLYVQDSSGGVQVAATNPPTLRIGDEVQVTGTVEPHDFSATLRNASVHLLWAGTPIPPVSVTSSQAATGAFDASFIEVKGYLRAKQVAPDKSLVLLLDDGQQQFRAIMSGGRATLSYSTLRIGSLISLRGICTVSSQYTQNLTPFSLLLRSTDDVSVIAGPPWWTVRHLVILGIVLLFLVVLAQLLYHRIESWRMRAVLEERERLAHEMHDTLAQSFAGIGFQLEAVRNELTAQSTTAQRHLDLASNLVRHSHQEARHAIATLRPEFLQSMGLLRALEHSAAKLVADGPVKIYAGSRGVPGLQPLSISDTLFRIGQEAIANAVRHAQASRLDIHLDYEPTAVQLTIKDNGNGFRHEADALGFGIRGMRKRADMIGALFTIEGKPGEGTTVTVTAALPPKLSLRTFPRYAWKYLREHRIHGKTASSFHPHTYRG